MYDTDDDQLLFHFKLVPHRGLSRIIYALNKLRVSTQASGWKLWHGEQAIRVERSAEGGTRLTLGVSRQPLVGHISWASVHGQNDINESSAILRISYQETGKIWSCEYVLGVFEHPAIDGAIAELFVPGTRSFVFTHEDMVNAYMQRFVDIFDHDI